MKKVFGFLVLVSVSLFTTSVWSDQGLRSELERSMLKTRQAVMDADLEAFVSSIDAVNPHARITRDRWTQLLANNLGRKLLLKSAQDLRNNTVFLTIKTFGDWAAYYAESNLDDENYQTLSVFLFRHSSSGWRPAGKSYGLTKASPGSRAAETYAAWRGRQGMLETLEINRDFSINKLIRTTARR